MKLNFTINGKWVDAVEIDPAFRRNGEYLEEKKRFLETRHKEKIDRTKGRGEFYLDPVADEVPVQSFAANQR